MSNVMDSIRSKSWILKVTLMSVVLGMLLAVSLKTQQRLRSEDVGSRTWPELVSAYKDTKQYNEKLQQRIAELQNKKTEYELQLGQGSSAAKTLNDELQKMKFLAGLLPAEGPGVIVTLQDSKRKPPPDAPWLVVQESIIHDSDIRNVVNELRAAEAEFISVNDQRLIATSAIRCRGPVTQVNGVATASPFEIKAIGDPKVLETALRINGGVVDSFSADPSMINVRPEARIVVPPYTGGLQFKWGKSVPGD